MKGPNPFLGLALRFQRQIGPGSWRLSSCLGLGPRVGGSPGEDHIDTGPVGLAALTPGGAENPPIHPGGAEPPATALVHSQPRLQPLLTPTRHGLTASWVSLAAHVASPTYVDNPNSPKPTSSPTVNPVSSLLCCKIPWSSPHSLSAIPSSWSLPLFYFSIWHVQNTGSTHPRYRVLNTMTVNPAQPENENFMQNLHMPVTHRARVRPPPQGRRTLGLQALWALAFYASPLPIRCTV